MKITLSSKQKDTIESQELPIGRHKIGDLTISNFDYLKIPEGLVVTFYEQDDFSGAQHNYTDDVTLSADFYKKVGSIEVETMKLNESIGINGTEFYPDEESCYIVRNKNSGHVFTAKEDSKIKDGDNLVQAKLKGIVDRQLWKFVNLHNEHYRIIRKGARQAVDVAGGTTTSKKTLYVYKLHSESNQHWKFWSLQEGCIAMQARNSGRVIDVTGSSSSEGANIQQYKWQSTEDQKWKLERIRPDIHKDSYYKIIASHSGKVIAIDSVGSVIQTAWDGTDSQLWKFTKMGEDYYEVVNKKSGKVLNVNGGSTEDEATIIQWTAGSGDNQQWWISLLDDGNVRFVAKHSKKVLNVADNSEEDGGILIQWNWQGDRNEKFKLERHTPEIDTNAYYQIKNKHSKRVMTVKSASSNEGANLIQSDWKLKYEQFWKFIPTDNGYYRIVNKKSGKVVSVKGGSTGNNANVEQASWNEKTHQEWKLDFVEDGVIRIVARHSGKIIDISRSSTNEGANIQQYPWTPSEDQKWILEKIEANIDTNSYYQIVNSKSNKVLAVEDHSTENKGNVIQTTWNNQNSQLWQFIPTTDGYYQIINKNSGKVIDESTVSGSHGGNIHQYDYVGNANQQWKLEVLEDGFIKIVARHSNLAVTIHEGSTANGANVIQWPWRNKQSQVFKLEKTVLTIDPDAFYKIIDLKTKNPLSVEDASMADGGNIISLSYNEGLNQLWRFIPTEGGYYRIVNRASNKVIAVQNALIADGTNVIQWKSGKGSNEQWKIDPSSKEGFTITSLLAENKVLSVSGAGNLEIYTNNNYSNQRFKFEKITIKGEVGEPDPETALEGTLDTIQTQALVLGGHQLRLTNQQEIQKNKGQHLLKIIDVSESAKEIIKALKTRLEKAIDNKELSLTKAILGDFGVIGDFVGNILDVFVKITNPKISLNETATKLNVEGQVTLFSVRNVTIKLEFFVYKNKPHCSFRYELGDVGFGSIISGSGDPIINGVNLSNTIFIAATSNTIYDEGLDSGINQGINIYADFLLKDSPSDFFKFIGEVLLLEKLSFHGAIDTSERIPFYLFEVSMVRNIPIVNSDSLKIKYTRSDVSFELKEMQPSATLSTDIAVTIGDTRLVFTGGFGLKPKAVSGFFTLNGTGKVKNGRLVGSLKKTTAWEKPFGIPGLTIRQFSAELGIGYATGLTKVGIHGDLVIGEDRLSRKLDGSISVLVDTDKPKEFILAGKTDSITIFEVISCMTVYTAIAYQQIPAKVRAKLDKVVNAKLEDVKINIVPTACSIGGVHFAEEGVTIKGTLKCWGWKASTYLNLDYTEGITVRGEMEPIIIGNILEITGAGNDPGPKLNFRISPTEFPSLYVSARVKLLFISFETKLVANKNGLDFQFHHAFGNLLSINLACSYSDYNLEATGSIDFNLNATVNIPLFGNIQLLDIGFTAAASLAIGKDLGFQLTLKGSFRFYGKEINFGELVLTTEPNNIRAIYTAVIDKAKTAVINVFTDIFDTLEKWVNAVKDGIINCYNIAAEAVTKALQTAYNATIETAAKALKIAEYGINAVAEGLTTAFNAVGEVAQAVIDEIGKALSTAFNAVENAVAGALMHAGYALEQVGNAILNVFNAVPDMLAAALDFAGFVGNEIGNFFTNTLGGAFVSFWNSITDCYRRITLGKARTDIMVEGTAGDFLRNIMEDEVLRNNVILPVYFLPEGDWNGLVDIGRKNGFEFTIAQIKEAMPVWFFNHGEREENNPGWHISALEL